MDGFGRRGSFLDVLSACGAVAIICLFGWSLWLFGTTLAGIAEGAPLDFEAASGIARESIASIIDPDGNEAEPDGFLRAYGRGAYKPYQGATDGGTPRTWICLDADGNELLSWTDLGNRDLVLVLSDGLETVYRKER